MSKKDLRELTGKTVANIQMVMGLGNGKKLVKFSYVSGMEIIYDEVVVEA